VLFERAAQLYQMLGDVRGEGESLFWVGIVHQVVRHDDDTAVPILQRSYELATRADTLTLSYALRHLGVAEHAAGRLDAARERLEESVRLRREIGFMPGVAASLVGLSYIAVAQGRRDEARALVEEAGAIAEASGADPVGCLCRGKTFVAGADLVLRGRGQAARRYSLMTPLRTRCRPTGAVRGTTVVGS
jgi:hypothetical protein